MKKKKARETVPLINFCLLPSSCRRSNASRYPDALQQNEEKKLKKLDFDPRYQNISILILR